MRLTNEELAQTCGEERERLELLQDPIAGVLCSPLRREATTGEMWRTTLMSGAFRSVSSTSIP